MDLLDAKAGLIALGANLSAGGFPPENSVRRAMARICDIVDNNALRSRLFRSPAFPTGSGPDFVNAAIRVSWGGSAAELLGILHRIEEEFGRIRAQRWEARVIDLDLLALGDAVLPDAATRAEWVGLTPEEAACKVPDQLILPHPRLAERAFVLIPLAEVAPDWVEPMSGLSVRQMLAACPAADLAAIRPIIPASC